MFLTRGLPIIITGPSGREIAAKTAVELEDICNERLTILETGRNPNNFFEDNEVKKLRHLLRVEGGIKPHLASLTRFANTEYKSLIPVSVRERDVFLVYQLFDPRVVNLEDLEQRRSINDNIMACLLTIDALRQSSADKITLILPMEAYGRQDQPRGREPIATRLLANLYKTAGIDGLITFDMHCDKTPAAYNNRMHVENLHVSELLILFLKEELGFKLDEYGVISPDTGGTPRAKYYNLHMGGKGIGFGAKGRDYTKPNTVEELKVYGEMPEKVIIVDDMISTAGTLCKVVDYLIDQGVKEVIAVCAHFEASGNAKERLDDLYDHGKGVLKCVVTTDTVIHPEPNIAWLRQTSVSRILAKAIYSINMGLSVSNIYNHEDDLLSHKSNLVYAGK